MWLTRLPSAGTPLFRFLPSWEGPCTAVVVQVSYYLHSLPGCRGERASREEEEEAGPVCGQVEGPL